MITMPEGLRAKATARPLTHWNTEHNRAVSEFERGVLPLGPERAVLGLAYGIAQWCNHHGADGFSREHVITPLFQAFSDALNYDLGRLDGGTLSSWAAYEELCEHPTLEARP